MIIQKNTVLPAVRISQDIDIGIWGSSDYERDANGDMTDTLRKHDGTLIVIHYNGTNHATSVFFEGMDNISIDIDREFKRENHDHGHYTYSKVLSFSHKGKTILHLDLMHLSALQENSSVGYRLISELLDLKTGRIMYNFSTREIAESSGYGLMGALAKPYEEEESNRLQGTKHSR